MSLVSPHQAGQPDAFENSLTDENREIVIGYRQWLSMLAVRVVPDISQINFSYSPKSTDEIQGEFSPVLPFFDSVYAVAKGIATGELQFDSPFGEEQLYREVTALGFVKVMDVIHRMGDRRIAWSLPKGKQPRGKDFRYQMHAIEQQGLLEAEYIPELGRFSLGYFEQDPRFAIETPEQSLKSLIVEIRSNLICIGYGQRETTVMADLSVKRVTWRQVGNGSVRSDGTEDLIETLANRVRPIVLLGSGDSSACERLQLATMTQLHADSLYKVF